MCIDEKIGPYWRNHQSLKGWCSVNYPTTLQNPLLQRKETLKKQMTRFHEFSNQQRPITGYQISSSYQRPFSTRIGGETLMKHRQQQRIEILKKDPSLAQLNDQEIMDFVEKKQNDLASVRGDSKEKQITSDYKDKSSIFTKDKGMPHIKTIKRLNSARCVDFNFARNVQSAINRKYDVSQKRYSMARPTLQQAASVERAFAAAPAKAVKKSKKQLEEEKKAKEEEEERQKLIPKVLTDEAALDMAVSWQNSVNIRQKSAVGILATSKYLQRTKAFADSYASSEQYSNILPMSNYFGKKPDPEKDPFDRRVCPQLSDISFSEESEDDFEDVKYIKRQPKTVLTEENLRRQLNEETQKLDLEHHYWLGDSFLSKLGRMAQNLRVLSLRRLKISDNSFNEIFIHLKTIQRLDISDCPFIQEKGLQQFLESCGQSLTHLQVSNCQDAVTDNTIAKVANIEDCKLTLLDISYCKRVTDNGMINFEGKKLPITHLFIKGISSTTSLGFYHIISTCTQTLQILEASLNDQETLAKGEFAKALAFCFNIECLDLGSCKALNDEFFSVLTSGEIQEGDLMVRPGFQKLETVRLNLLEIINNFSVQKLLAAAPNCEHLELTGCLALTEYLLEKLFKEYPSLKFIDVNHIPAMTPALFEVAKQTRPDIYIRRFNITEVDPKDNMLRVPWRVIQKKKKKKKKKGGKKKK